MKIQKTFPHEKLLAIVVASLILAAGSIGVGASSGVRPTLTDIQIKNITGGSGEVAWTTDIDSRGVLDVYEGSKFLRSFPAPGDEVSKIHLIRLINLKKNATYKIVVKAFPPGEPTDPDLIAESTPKFFTTTEKPVYGVAPSIKNIQPYFSTGTTASVSWETDRPTYGKIYFGMVTSATPDQAFQRKLTGLKYDNAFSAKHDATITGLEPGRVYNFKIEAYEQDGSSSSTVSDLNTFLTFKDDADETRALEITDIKPTDARDPGVFGDSAAVSWKTNIPGAGIVHYGKDNARGLQILTEPPRKKIHLVALTGLQPQTFYTFTIEARDVRGKTLVSPVQSFTTKKGPAGTGGVARAGVNAGKSVNSASQQNISQTKKSTLVKVATRPYVYLVENGQKKFIRNEQIFKAHGWRFTDVETIPESVFRAIPTGVTIIK